MSDWVRTPRPDRRGTTGRLGSSAFPERIWGKKRAAAGRLPEPGFLVYGELNPATGSTDA
jgi:hypothetical protein